MDNYNYPMGADTPDAPWNDTSGTLDPVEADVMVSYSISKSTTIETDDYIEEPWEDWDIDEEGKTVHTGGMETNWDDTNWEQAFNDDPDALGIPDLLNILEEHATIQYHLYEDALELKPKDKDTKRLVRKWENIRKACQDWHVDEFIVEHE